MSVVAGCVLPPAVTVVSLALDGISIVTTGKTVSDHALSAMVEQDCALVRMFTEQKLSAVCRVDGETAFADASTPAPASLASITTLDRRSELPAVVAPVFTSTRKPSGELAAAPAPALTVAIKPSGELAAAAITGLDLEVDKVDGTPGSPILVAWEAGADTEFALSMPGDSAKGVGNRRATYLVVGSFRLAERAERLASQLSGLTTGISLGIVDNNVYFRVVTGPLEGDELEAVRARLAATGIPDAWAINLCTADLSAPPCDPPATPARGPKTLTVAASGD